MTPDVAGAGVQAALLPAGVGARKAASAESSAPAGGDATTSSSAGDMVAAVRGLLASVRDGEVPAEAVEPLVGSLVAMLEGVEASINALTARRAALMAAAAAVVEHFPGTMVPLLDGADVTARDRDHARRALVADVATATGTSELTTAARVDSAVTLTDGMPRVLTAMAEGRLGEAHARHLVRHAEGLPSGSLERYEQDVLSRLRGDRSPARVGALARAARERVHPRPLPERHAAAAQERAVHLDPAPDGMAWLGALLPAVQAHAVFDKLTGIAHALRACEGETRTLAQCRADALTSLTLESWDASAGTCATPRADDAASTSEPTREGATSGASDPEDGASDLVLDPALRSLRPTVAVTVPALTLLGLSDEPGSLEGHGPIDPDTARLLAAHAPSFVRLLTDPETGTVLSVGRTRYTVPADLRTWLRLRDETCRFPGCRRPAARCDVDHTTPYREGGARGPTAAANLAHLCRTHHRLKHTSRWTVEHLPDARLEWTSPTGRRHRTEPGRDLPPTSPPDISSSGSPPDGGAGTGGDQRLRTPPGAPPISWRATRRDPREEPEPDDAAHQDVDDAPPF